jgi:hypothetical protein
MTAGIYSQLKDKHGDKVELLEDQEWIKNNWDWILKDET